MKRYRKGDRAWHPLLRCESLSSLSEQFTESRILRLASTKPSRLTDCSEVRRVLKEIKKFRYYACVAGDSVYDNGREVPVDKKCKGWFYADPLHDNLPSYATSNAKIAKLDLLIEDLEERIIQLKAEEIEAAEALKRSNEAVKRFEKAGQDKKLAGALWHALDILPPPIGFVYFKRWTMPDGSCWFKVGITNNADRRENEQNVLPVAAETIVCVDVGSMDRARAVEAVVHQVLEEQRITDANNRVLFHLSDQQAAAVKAVLEKLA